MVNMKNNGDNLMLFVFIVILFSTISGINVDKHLSIKENPWIGFIFT